MCWGSTEIYSIVLRVCVFSFLVTFTHSKIVMLCFLQKSIIGKQFISICWYIMVLPGIPYGVSIILKWSEREVFSWKKISSPAGSCPTRAFLVANPAPLLPIAIEEVILSAAFVV